MNLKKSKKETFNSQKEKKIQRLGINESILFLISGYIDQISETRSGWSVA